MPMVVSVTLNAVYVTALLFSLWLYKSVLALRNRLRKTTQFSMKDLLMLMTLTAVLAALLGEAKMLQQSWAFTFFFILNGVTVAIASLVFGSRAWHWIWRLAATLAVAIGGGWCLAFLRPHLAGDLEVLNCLEAFMILIWLEFGEIIPSRNVANDGDAVIAPMKK